MSNKSEGNKFETEMAEKLFQEGFWVHLLQQNAVGQPADMIAVRNGKALLIDCKVCGQRGFAMTRIESNQETAMQFWNKCGNGRGWFALKLLDESVYMFSDFLLTSLRQDYSVLNEKGIRLYGKAFEEWVAQWK